MSTVISRRPRFAPADAAAIVRELYGLEGSLAPLPSERDQNFLLHANSGERLVLKIAREGEHEAELDLQNRALEWLSVRAPSLAVPRLRKTDAGEAVTRAVAPSGSSHLVRILSFLPGIVLARARPRSQALLRSLGRFMGTFDAALSGFRHPAAPGRDLAWNPERALEVTARHLAAVPEPRQRRIVESWRARFAEIAVPLLPTLPRSIIHNDANDYNVLVGEPHATQRGIVGLLDFGDMLESWTVAELAVAAAYALLDQPDPLLAASLVVSGYHEARALSEAELAALFVLTGLRLCTSVCLSASRAGLHAGDEYLTISEAPAWRALEKLEAVHPRFAEYTFRAACGLPPCPRTASVGSWLRTHRECVQPPLAADWSRAVVFDLGAANAEFGSPADTADMPGLEAQLFGHLRAADVEVGIGRYDEARLLYAGDAYKGPDGEHPERRTIHLGIDLFAKPGSPVFAALEGRIQSFADNAAPLDYGPTLLLAHEPEGGPAFYTLYGHLSRDSLNGLRVGAPIAKGQTIGRVGLPSENGGWPPHLHFQIVSDLMDSKGDFPGVAAPSQRAVWLGLCPDPNLILRLPEDRLRAEQAEPAELLADRRRRLGPSLSLAYRAPLEIVRGVGTTLYDQAGRAYLDVVNNVAHVGHGHPRVVEAGRRQMAALNTNTRYLHPHILRYARRLAALLPEPLGVCFFVCSGSEANELALRLARAHTRGTDLLVLEGAYHGNTATLIDASPYKFDGPGGSGKPPYVHKLPMPDDYRGLYRRDDPARGERFATHVTDAVAEAVARGGRPAALLCESLLGAGGQIELPPGYLQAAYRLARAAGAVCIADEVQVGFGRVGSHFWGFQTQGVVPDIVTLGKPIGNGHPLGAVVTTPEIAASFANGMEYFNTFGGNPVSCAIGLAVLDVIRDEGLQERARGVGGRLKTGLDGLRQRHAILGDVRGRGLFLGVELVRDRETLEPAAEEAAYVVERLKDRGILVSTDGPLHNVIKLKPPLCFGDSDAERLVAAFDAILGEDFVTARLG